MAGVEDGLQLPGTAPTKKWFWFCLFGLSVQTQVSLDFCPHRASHPTDRVNMPMVMSWADPFQGLGLPQGWSEECACIPNRHLWKGQTLLLEDACKSVAQPVWGHLPIISEPWVLVCPWEGPATRGKSFGWKAGASLHHLSVLWALMLPGPFYWYPGGPTLSELSPAQL